MLVYSNHQLEKFQILGSLVRVHWNHLQYEIVDEIFENNENLSSTRIAWVCNEAAVPINASRMTFVELVSAAGGDGEALANEWFS